MKSYLSYLVLGVALAVGYGAGSLVAGSGFADERSSYEQRLLTAQTERTEAVADEFAALTAENQRFAATIERSAAAQKEAQALYASVLAENGAELLATRKALREARKENAPLLDTRLPDALVCRMRGQPATCAGSGSVSNAGPDPGQLATAVRSAGRAADRGHGRNTG